MASKTLKSFTRLLVFAFFLWEACPMTTLAQDANIIDLTHPFDETTIYWPTETGFRFEKEFGGPTEKGYYYAANKFSAPEHGGTHIDAPRHFAEGHPTVDEIPLNQLVGAGILVDVSKKAEKNPDYLVQTEDFQDWEKAHGPIPGRSIILIKTGYEKFWPDRKKYLGTEERGQEAVAKLHFPGLDPKAAQWLVTNRKIKAVGLDTASIDYGQSTLFESHRYLFAHDVPALENLANLEGLPPKDFQVIALPMKIKGGSGAPLRVIAILGK